MDYKEEILLKLKAGEKAYFRGGTILRNILSKKYSHEVPSEEALLIYNTYGIPPQLLKIFFYSHGLSMDDEEFATLLDLQWKDREKTVLCMLNRSFE